MRALVVEGPGRFAVGDVPEPVPGRGEATVDVLMSGICGTDLQLVAGYMGFTGIPGHEFIGRVARVSSPHDHVLLGARVVGEINVGCDDCPRCMQGLGRHCSRRSVLGILNRSGAFSERITLPVSNLHAVPDVVPDEVAVFVEPLAAAFEILAQVVVAPAQRVLVLGDGRLGILAARALASAGAGVVLAGHHPEKLALCRGQGITALLAPEEMTSEQFDLVVETTGSPRGLDDAVARTRPRGTVIMKSTCVDPTSFDASRAVVNEIALVGSRCGAFAPAIAALREGKVKVDDLVTRTLPLDEAAEGMRRAAEPETLKVLLRVAR